MLSTTYPTPLGGHQAVKVQIIFLSRIVAVLPQGRSPDTSQRRPKPSVPAERSRAPNKRGYGFQDRTDARRANRNVTRRMTKIQHRSTHQRKWPHGAQDTSAERRFIPIPQPFPLYGGLRNIALLHIQVLDRSKGESILSGAQVLALVE